MLGALAARLGRKLRYCDLWGGFVEGKGISEESVDAAEISAETVKSAFLARPELFCLFSPYIFALIVSVAGVGVRNQKNAEASACTEAQN